MRRIRRIRQLVPTKFATVHRMVFPDLPDDHPDQNAPEFVRWWMWMGRCFRIQRTAI